MANEASSSSDPKGPKKEFGTDETTEKLQLSRVDTGKKRKDTIFIADDTRGEPKTRMNKAVRSIFHESGSANEFLQRCKAEQPFVYAMQLKNLEYAANYEWPPVPEAYVPMFSDFPNLPSEIRDWMNNNICCQPKPDSPISIVIEGPSRIGKTHWARSIGPHNYFSGCMDFSGYSNEAQYNVIDNIEFKACKNVVKLLLGSKRDYTANVRYGKPIKVRGGIPSIVLINPDMSWKEQFSLPFAAWFEYNAVYVYLYESLF